MRATGNGSRDFAGRRSRVHACRFVAFLVKGHHRRYARSRETIFRALSLQKKWEKSACFLSPSLNMPKSSINGYGFKRNSRADGEVYRSIPFLGDYAATFIHLLRIFLLFTCTCSVHKILLKFSWPLVLVQGKR